MHSTYRESSGPQVFATMHNVNVNADSSVVAEDDNNNISINRSDGVNERANGAAHVNRKRLVVVGLGMVALGEDMDRLSFFMLRNLAD